MSETVSSGNSPYVVSSGQTDTGDLVVNGGSIVDLSGGAVDTTSAGSSGSLTIDLGGLASGTMVTSGGIVFVDGPTIGTQVSGGATEIVSFGGIDNGTTLIGGTEIVSSGGTVDGTVTFSGSGELILDQSSTFGGTISGLSNTSEKLDLADISFGSTTSMSYSGNTLSGTLTVTDGTNTANVQLLGDYTITSFTSASDGNGGTLIEDPPPQELFFANTYAFDTTTTLGQEFVKCIVAAEQTFEYLWTTPAYITLTFGLADLGGFNDGFITLADNQASGTVNVTYSQLKGALAAQEDLGNNPYGQIAAQNLSATNPAAGNAEWTLPEAYARMLGLSSATHPTTDDTITINSNSATGLSFDQNVTNVLEHEISEQAMGRLGGLGDQNGIWSTMDLFRYSSAGTLDDTDGKTVNGKTNSNPYFSYDGGTILSPQQFNDRYGPNPPNDPTGDTADFINYDVFGEGGGTYLSQTDVQIMDVLGWTPSSNVLWVQGTSGDFASVSNWLVPGVPGPNNDVIINPFWGVFGSSVVNPFTVSSFNNETINSLTTGSAATLDIAGGAFSITSGGLNEGAMIVSSGASLLLDGLLNDTGTVEASSGAIDLAGQLFVSAGGTAIATSVLSGATQEIESGGYASGAVVDDGTQLVFAGATASATTVNSGGTNIVNDGVVIGDTVDNGGLEQINYGSAVATIVNSGGTETVEGQADLGSTLIGTTVNSGGNAFLYQSAVMTGTVIDNGAITIAGGQFSGTLTGSGSVFVEDYYPFVLTGGDGFSGSFVVSGSTLELSSATAAGAASIVLSGGDDVLRIDGSTMPGNVISGLANGDVIDLAQVPFSSGSVTVTSGNVLQISEGGSTFKLQLDPHANYTSASFTLSPDGAGGTFVAFGENVVASSSVVSAGQTASNLLVVAAGTLTVLSGGTATSVIGVGTENISSGGVTDNTTLNGGTQYDSGTASGTIINMGSQTVYGVADNTSVTNSARQFVESGGTASVTVVSGGGSGKSFFGGTPNGSWQEIDAGASATATTVVSNGVQDVYGVAIGTICSAGGIETIDATSGETGTGTNTTVNSGGTLYDYGAVIGATVNNGGHLLIAPSAGVTGGTASGTIVNSGGEQEVSATSATIITGGTSNIQVVYSGEASGTIVSGGLEQVDVGGVALATSVNGGSQVVFGSAVSTTVNSGGILSVGSGGTATDANINSGGRQVVEAAGEANATTIDSGGSEFISSGGTATGVTISGGMLELASSGSFGSPITFAGPAGTLRIDAP